MSAVPAENFASHLSAVAARRPEETALVCPRPFGAPARAPAFSFRRLQEESEILARGLLEVGVGPGVRTMFMVPPGIHFFAFAFALFKAGAVLTGVDPGMGRRNMGQCIGEADPGAFIGIPLAHAFRRLMGWGGEAMRILISTARRTSARSRQVSLTTLRELGTRSDRPLPAIGAADPAIVAFTSGSTGPPKGVIYTHGMLNAQLASLRDLFDIEEGERDLVTFPHFGLFGPGLGVTLVLANMDFGRPGRAFPSWIVRSLRAHRITNLFGSPALLARVGRYGTAEGLKLPSLRRVVCAGAPVPARVVRDLVSMLEGGRFYTPYGATEALPVTSIGAEELLGETQARTDEGHGVCVGRPVAGMDVRIIRITEDVIEQWSDELEVPEGEVGEIVVSGPVASRAYCNRPDATSRAKITRDGGFFHRMGDLGYLDSTGRLWFCGRKSHRVVTGQRVLYTVPVESVFNTHPKVLRSALVGVRGPDGVRPVLCVQTQPRVSHREWPGIRAELHELAASRPDTSMIRDILRRRRFPVDRRHNAKIGREQLAVWAEGRVR